MRMKLPYPKQMDVTPIEVNIFDGITENGVPNVVLTYKGKCYFSESSKTIWQPEGKSIILNGKIFVGSDIAPTVSEIKGEVDINSKTYKIYKGKRPRNPDGTVHHTELELI